MMYSYAGMQHGCQHVLLTCTINTSPAFPLKKYHISRNHSIVSTQHSNTAEYNEPLYNCPWNNKNKISKNNNKCGVLNSLDINTTKAMLQFHTISRMKWTVLMIILFHRSTSDCLGSPLKLNNTTVTTIVECKSDEFNNIWASCTLVIKYLSGEMTDLGWNTMNERHDGTMIYSHT